MTGVEAGVSPEGKIATPPIYHHGPKWYEACRDLRRVAGDVDLSEIDPSLRGLLEDFTLSVYAVKENVLKRLTPLF